MSNNETKSDVNGPSDLAHSEEILSVVRERLEMAVESAVLALHAFTRSNFIAVCPDMNPQSFVVFGTKEWILESLNDFAEDSAGEAQ